MYSLASAIRAFAAFHREKLPFTALNFHNTQPEITVFKGSLTARAGTGITALNKKYFEYSCAEEPHSPELRCKTTWNTQIFEFSLQDSV